MTLTNQQIALVRSVAMMTEPYFTIEKDVARQANYEEMMTCQDDDAVYFDRAKWLQVALPEVRKETGIVKFASK